MKLKIIFTDGSIFETAVNNKAEAETFAPAIDSTVTSAILHKEGKTLRKYK